MDEGITEFELIDLIKAGSTGSARLKTGVGDDAAVTVPGGATATSVDAIVEGVHFRREWSPPDAIARKALGSALSDLAAMGAEPGEIYVTLGVPRGTDPGFLKELAEGFLDTADRFGAVLAGGDTVSSRTLFVSVTVVGHAPDEDRFVLRSGAVPGEIVAVTGELGGAAAGHWLLHRDSSELDADQRALVERQLRPVPRLAAGSALAASGAGSMVDVSDGLMADLAHVAAASGVSIDVDPELVPVQAGVEMVAAAAGETALGLALSGGEDYELAVTMPESRFEEARAALAGLNVRLTRIGRVGSGSGVSPEQRGYDHFG
ncbi:MAG TPA: thiamine-phosphate kinase [Solirubrobacterales bacterium]|nr:thiamine-phosphate kinase [Solirubrobacterales bacterium]